MGIREEQWVRLSKRRIFFGHQSVGYNLMDGVADLMAAAPRIRPEFRESRNADAMRSPGFFHARVGRNQFPLEKLRDFAALAEDAFEGQEGIALVKLCYIDVSAGTDPLALFDAYRRTVADLAARRPEIRLEHVTMPLTTARHLRRERAGLRRRVASDGGGAAPDRPGGASALRPKSQSATRPLRPR